MASRSERIKVKRLDCPFLIKGDSEIAREMRLCSFISVQPRFFRDGRYLVNNSVVLVECGGLAWQSSSDSAVRAFYRELENSCYENVNILSMEQRMAISTLVKIGLATDTQFALMQRDASKRALAMESFRWRNAGRQPKTPTKRRTDGQGNA